MFHRGIRGRFRLAGRTDDSASIEAAGIGCDIAGRAFIAGANARSFTAYSIFMLCFEIASVSAITAFYSTVIHAHAG